MAASLIALHTDERVRALTGTYHRPPSLDLSQDGVSDVTFPWDTLHSIIGGRSALDVPQLHLFSLEEAHNFLLAYGFDWTLPGDREIIEKARQEAIGFLEEELLDDEPDLCIPEHIRKERDVRKLMLWASQRPIGPQQRWCCALLRVMHTISHSQSYFNERFTNQIRTQILQRFEPHLHHEHKGDKGLYLGQHRDAIPLVRFEVKQAKTLRSVVMKLLHKAENVAADVFDRIGVRVVTWERFDALMAIRYLRSKHLIMFANIKPSRSRNTLIDLQQLQQDMSVLDEMVREGIMPATHKLQALRQRVRDQNYPSSKTRDYNHHSAVDYHSIQFTCRQQIKVPEPYSDPHDPNRPTIRFFFPYEVQILDQESYEISRSGLASHDEYKKRQRNTVKERVLGGLLQMH